jgi:uroporphyrinogen-III synthase
MSAAGVRSAVKFFDLRKYKLVAVGGTTRRELKRRGCKHVLVPHVQNLDGVRKLLREEKLGRILAFRSPLAEERLGGAVNIIAYRVKPKNLGHTVGAYLKTKNNFTLLTSSGLLKYLLRAVGKLGLRKNFVQKLNESFVISLGKEITKFALKNGIAINHEPDEPNIDVLFRKITRR